MPILRQIHILAAALLLLAYASASMAERTSSYFKEAEDHSLVSASIQSEVEPLQEDGDRHQTVCSCSSCENVCDGGGIDYVLIGRGTGMYYSVPGETKFAGSYGIEGAVKLIENWGLFGSLDVSHFSRGTQYSGTLGLIKLPDYSRCDVWGRTTFMTSFDQAGDSRFSGLYLNQLRFLVGYSPTDTFQVGATFGLPTNEADVFVRFDAFPAFSFPVTTRMARTIGGYAAWQLGNVQLAAQVGHQSQSNELTSGLGFRILHSDRLATYAGGSFGARKGTWGATAGIALAFGPGSRSSSSNYVCSAARDGQIIRGQSPNTVRLVSVPNSSPDSQQPSQETSIPLYTSRDDLNEDIAMELWSYRFNRRLSYQVGMPNSMGKHLMQGFSHVKSNNITLGDRDDGRITNLRELDGAYVGILTRY